MTVFQELLKKKPALWDGGLGSMLLSAGLRPGEVPEGWNIEKPEAVSDVHRQYFTAGSDVVQTNTFGGNAVRLQEAKCRYTVEEVNAAGVRAALGVRPEGKFVAGSLGPSGLSFPPLGKADENQIAEIYGRQAAALAAAGADLLSVETVSDLREARAALRGIKKVCKLPVIVSLTFRQTPRGFFTIMGNPAVSSLKALFDDGADAAGANCTLSPKAMVLLARELRQSIPGPLLIQPNAGDPVMDPASHRVTYPESPADFTAALEPLFTLGIEFLGGCCGTGPKHIAGLAGLRKSPR